MCSAWFDLLLGIQERMENRKASCFNFSSFSQISGFHTQIIRCILFLGHCLFLSVFPASDLYFSSPNSVPLSFPLPPGSDSFLSSLPSQIGTTARVIFVILFLYVLNCARSSNLTRVCLLITRPSCLLVTTQRWPLLRSVCCFGKGSREQHIWTVKGYSFFSFLHLTCIYFPI